jgi:hypothetical protein
MVTETIASATGVSDLWHLKRLPYATLAKTPSKAASYRSINR